MIRECYEVIRQIFFESIACLFQIAEIFFISVQIMVAIYIAPMTLTYGRFCTHWSLTFQYQI